jgi:hypothetical protein
MEQKMNDDVVPRRRRFPAPWRVERIDGGFMVTDANGFRLAYVYSPPNHADLGTAAVIHLSEDEARRIAAGIARLPELLANEKKD